MLHFKALITIFVAVSAATGISAQSLTIEDLSPLFEKEWTGTLTYLDYSSDKEVDIPVELMVKRKTDYTAEFNFTYPGESSANSTSKMKISKDGTSFNDQKVVEVNRYEDFTEIITTSTGKDNGEKALFTYTYAIGPDMYLSQKMVKVDSKNMGFVRNSYVFKPKD